MALSLSLPHPLRAPTWSFGDLLPMNGNTQQKSPPLVAKRVLVLWDWLSHSGHTLSESEWIIKTQDAHQGGKEHDSPFIGAAGTCSCSHSPDVDSASGQNQGGSCRPLWVRENPCYGNISGLRELSALPHKGWLVEAGHKAKGTGLCVKHNLCGNLTAESHRVPLPQRLSPGLFLKPKERTRNLTQQLSHATRHQPTGSKPKPLASSQRSPQRSTTPDTQQAQRRLAT